MVHVTVTSSKRLPDDRMSNETLQISVQSHTSATDHLLVGTFIQIKDLV